MEIKPCCSSSIKKLILTEKKPIYYFPQEIITEILIRLPVKSLLQFRCVSKSWASLISSQEFIKSHLKIASLSNLRKRVMLTLCIPNFDLKHCSANSLFSTDCATDVFNIDYPMKNPNRAVWVVGSCNGVVCIAINEQDLFLWNPCTRISKKLPPLNVKMKQGYYNIFGFGYNESNDDYKVLGILCSFGNSGVYESEVKMYSLRSNSWKRLDGFTAGLPLDDSCKFVGGKIHLAACPALGFDFKWDIVSFDLETELYGIVEQPGYGDGVVQSTLEVLGGCITVLCNKKSHADLWVMNEYGVKESWSKMVTISYFDDPGKFLYSKPLVMLPSGEILLVFKSRFVVYNPNDNSLRIPETSDLDEFLEADVYVETLVSPTQHERLG